MLDTLRQLYPNHPSIKVLAAQIAVNTGDMGTSHSLYMDAIADDLAILNQMQAGLEEIFYPQKEKQTVGDSKIKPVNS